jgi:hypothetical protein
MKSEQLSASLHAYARLLHQAGCVHGAHDLDALATVFDRGRDQTVAAIVKKVLRGRTLAGHVARHPALLKALLEHIASASEAAGATTVARDYEAAISLFTGSEGSSAGAFAEAAINSLVAAHGPAQPPPLDHALITGFADRLAAASSDNAKFDAVVAELKTPRKFSNATLAAIANTYLGVERTYKSKSEILKAITTRQLQDAIQSSRDRRIVKIAV